MKKLIILSTIAIKVAVASPFELAGSYNCTGDAGNKLKIKTNGVQAKTLWRGYKSIYAKKKSILGNFEGEGSNLPTDPIIKFDLKNKLSHLDGSLTLTKYEKKTGPYYPPCNRRVCSKAPSYDYELYYPAELIIQKQDSKQVYKFTCDKVKVK